ncbi:hypothetical protein BC6307_14820 [Sutcliffiella cohnii]|uniref:Uncharacterized protein n=1 Tax=Sutcliffiella cohnii TaxID=33932 RepID=A0A223KSK6_9BACI|nr:GerAB/ArcD/ProY family transporter [Sutcliffiella cohnii]AST92475.1 hypothetical protein BC6307_14820 [Sutcliffiella cohnii]
MDKGRFKKLNKYHVIFLVQNIMIGIGLLTLPKDISNVGNNQWIVPFLLGVIANISIFPIVYIGRKFPNDPFFIVIEKLWGKILGTIVHLLIIFYGILQVGNVIHSYLRLVQTVALPNYTVSFMSIALYIPLVTIVLGGIKSIARFCMFSFFFTAWMMIFTKWAFQAGHWVNVIPTWEVSLLEWGKSIHYGFEAFFGFGILAFFFPYIMDQKRAFLHASIGIWIVVIIYVIISLASVVYFSEWQLTNLLFPLLNLFQAVKLPFIERVEVFGTSLWAFLILSTSAAYLWISKKGFDAIFSKNKNRTWHLYAVAFLSWILFNGPIPFQIQLLLFYEWNIFYGYFMLAIPYLLMITYLLKNIMDKSSRKGGFTS